MIQPLSDKIVVEPVEAEKVTAGGIIIPDSAKEKPQRGTVVAAGKGRSGEPMTVKVGDTVLYSKNAGTQIEDEGKTYLIMREVDVFGIV